MIVAESSLSLSIRFIPAGGVESAEELEFADDFVMLGRCVVSDVPDEPALPRVLVKSDFARFS